jgi:hypothetical protein
MKAWQIMQNSRSNHNDFNIFDKEKFIEIVSNLSWDDFNLFCKTFLHLQLFHDSSSYSWATYMEKAIEGRERSFRKLEPADFNAPIIFEITEHDGSELEDTEDEISDTTLDDLLKAHGGKSEEKL